MRKTALFPRLTITILVLFGFLGLISGCLPVNLDGNTPELAGVSNGLPSQTGNLIIGAALIVLVIFLAVALRGKEDR